jgi:hypothetical protein
LLNVPNTDVEVVLAKLCAVTADLARSANIAVSRIVLRSKLSVAIADAGKAERAAEALRAAASAEVKEHEQTSVVPETLVGMMQQEHQMHSLTAREGGCDADYRERMLAFDQNIAIETTEVCF